MIRPISISELKARLSAHIERVRQGNEVLITDRGRLIARLVPASGNEHEESRRDLLMRTGRLRAPTAALPSDFWTQRRPEDPDGRSLDALHRERGSAR